MVAYGTVLVRVWPAYAWPDGLRPATAARACLARVAGVEMLLV
jgi:hypothetical protein